MGVRTPAGLHPLVRSVALVLGVMLAFPAEAQAALPPVEIGLPPAGVTYSGVVDHGMKAATAAFGTWRGAPAKTVVDFLGGDTWASIADTSWTAGRWQGVKTHYVWSMFIKPRTQPAKLSEVSTGKRDSVYRSAGAGLVRAGYAHSTIRIGWEMTGGWYNYGSGHESQVTYRSAYRRIVTVLQKVPGQHFTFDWNTGNPAVNPVSWYPGDLYVDFIGIDRYDGPGFFTAPAPYGLDWLAWYAGVHHKRLSLPEWGLRRYCGTRWPGYDDPKFIAYMRGWITQHKPAYEAYFNDNDNDCQMSRIYPGALFPAASAAYRKMW